MAAPSTTEDPRIKGLAKGRTFSQRDVLGAWESFCWRASLRGGYLLTESERVMAWPMFASSFATMTKGGITPLDAVDTFLELAAHFESEQTP